MNLLKSKQLVRESSGSIEEQQTAFNNRKMGLNEKFAWIVLFFCLGLIAMAHCIPVKVIYTGDGCDCPSKLDFSVNVPSVPKPKKHTPNVYGYKIQVPTLQETKEKVLYNFDFTVEEPRSPKPLKSTPKSNLFALIDRVAIPKGDCENTYYAESSAPSTCRCGQCAMSKRPHYRYVFNQMAPISPICNCQRSNCKCNVKREAALTNYSPNAIIMGPTISTLISESIPFVMSRGKRYNNDDDDIKSGGGDGAEVNTANKRHKRDLESGFFRRPRNKLNKERTTTNRFVKLYHRNLANRPSQRLFKLEGLINKQQNQHQPMPTRKMKRKSRKTPYLKQQRSRLVKRDIKGEYDLLEKEREQMDLTLPEIIQYMPETLQPDFKRSQCYFGGCNEQLPSHPESTENDNKDNDSSSDNSSDSSNPSSITAQKGDSKNKESELNKSSGFVFSHLSADTDTDHNIIHDHIDPNVNSAEIGGVDEQLIENAKDATIEKHDMSSSYSYTKRNAENLHAGSSTKLSQAESADHKCTSALCANAYSAHFTSETQPISTNPNYDSQELTQSKYALTAVMPLTTDASADIPKSHYCTKNNDEINKKYLNNDKNIHTMTSDIEIQNLNDQYNIPSLRYASGLDDPINDDHDTQLPHVWVPPVAEHKYSIKFIDSHHVDKLIANIVYSHPEFLYATSHLGGSLVDPPIWQEQEAKEYAKHLIDDRLNLLFGLDNKYSIQQHLPSVIPHQPPLFWSNYSKK